MKEKEPKTRRYDYDLDFKSDKRKSCISQRVGFEITSTERDSLWTVLSSEHLVHRVNLKRNEGSRTPITYISSVRL